MMRSQAVLLGCLVVSASSGAFAFTPSLPQAHLRSQLRSHGVLGLRAQVQNRKPTPDDRKPHPLNDRRAVIEAFGGIGAMAASLLLPLPAQSDVCSRKDCQPQANYLPEGTAPKKEDFTQGMAALQGKDYGKTKMKYPDYTPTPSGLQYKDAKKGTGPQPEKGDRVVFDWEGYTIGYYGRIFQAKNKVQGGAFADDTGYYRAIIGSGTLVPGLEEGLMGMKVGGVRQIVVPPEIGYPESDPRHEKVGPRPITFDGQRALDFVLGNKGLIDKTLLFNVKLVRVDKPGADGSFSRGDTK